MWFWFLTSSLDNEFQLHYKRWSNFYLKLCCDNEFGKVWLPYFVKPPYPSPHPTSYYYKVYGSSCLQFVLGVVKMICNLIWHWVLLFVFVLGRNNNVNFSWCKIWKEFLFEGWHVKFSKCILECGRQVGLSRFREDHVNSYTLWSMDI